MPNDATPVQGNKRKASDTKNLPPKHMGAQDIDTITTFCKQDYYDSHYKPMAARAMDLVNEQLKLEKILAKVTCRAKDPDSLCEKLIGRNTTRRYRSAQDIFDDIADLAGVRIILYTSNEYHRKRVESIIGSIWDNYTHVPHGQSGLPAINQGVQVKTTELSLTGNVARKKHKVSQPHKGSELYGKSQKSVAKYVAKHIGYTADHYRVSMRADQKGPTSIGPEYNDWRPTDRVEIQVMSALNHAWAEAGHDVLYKQHAFGAPTRDEQRILDSLRGLVSSGDLLLEQFYESVNRRTYAPFQNRDEFGIFLRNVDVLDNDENNDEENDAQRMEDRTTVYEKDFKPEGVDVWFDFLVKRGRNYPLMVRDALKGLNYPGSRTPKTEAILGSLKPAFEPPIGFLVPFCLLYQALGTVPEQAESHEERSPRQKVSTITLALTLLQMFAGNADVAQDLLLKSLAGRQKEYDGVRFALADPLRLHQPGAEHANIREEESPLLAPAWNWFHEQSTYQSSVCGIMFRLAKLGVTENDGANAFGRSCDIVLPELERSLASRELR